MLKYLFCVTIKISRFAHNFLMIIYSITDVTRDGYYQRISYSPKESHDTYDFFHAMLLTPLFPRRRVPGHELPYYANVLSETAWTWLWSLGDISCAPMGVVCTLHKAVAVEEMGCVRYTRARRCLQMLVFTDFMRSPC